MFGLLALALFVAPADTAVVGVLADPISLHPHLSADSASATIVTNVCETLVRFAPGSQRPQAALAISWATLDDRTWTFTLRPGVRFHDGAPFDADAVVKNLEELEKERAFPGHAERLGPLAVSVVLDRSNPSLLSTLSQPVFSLQSPRAPGSGAAAVGTGPFRLASSRPGLVELDANADYWGGAPRLNHLVFRRFATEEALVDALLSGDVDVSAAVGPKAAERLRHESMVVVGAVPRLGIGYLAINNEHHPFADVRVRQAIARALDRPALVAEAFDGRVEVARSLLAAPAAYDPTIRTSSLDRDAARRLLAEAGLREGLQATLLSIDSPRPFLPDPSKILARITADLGGVGIRVGLHEASTWADYLNRATVGDYDLAILGSLSDPTDPSDLLSALLSSEAVGTTNRSRYRSADMDAALKRIRGATEAASRRAAYHEVLELLQRDMPYVPLYDIPFFTVHGARLQDVVTNSAGLPRYDRVWKTQ